MENDLQKLWNAAYDKYKEPLNSIEKARLLALLIMDLREKAYGDVYKDFDSFEHEQGFYAQVADGTENRIPNGTSERLLKAMGLRHPAQLRQHRRLLRLPRPIWVWADDLDWTEHFIRTELDSLPTEEDMLRYAANRAYEENFSKLLLAEYAYLLSDEAKQTLEPYKQIKDMVADVESKLLSMDELIRLYALMELRVLVRQLEDNL